MTDTVTMRPASMSPAEVAVVTVMKGPVGAHVGILYRADDQGMRRHLHLADHLRLKDDPAPPADASWVEPRFDKSELEDLRTSASWIARRQQDGRVPYAFRPADARFDPAGTLQLGKSLGLTCATFIVLVFDHAMIKLLEATTWDQDRSAERQREDKAAQSRLVDYLRSRDARHAALVEDEVEAGCTRIRAEEVAAASGMTGHPITFARAEPQGRHVLAMIQPPPEVKRTGPTPQDGGASVASPADP